MSSTSMYSHPQVTVLYVTRPDPPATISDLRTSLRYTRILGTTFSVSLLVSPSRCATVKHEIGERYSQAQQYILQLYNVNIL
jgi:hypothetical protein